MFINDLIIKIREELGATTIAITHDMNSVRRIAKEVVYNPQWQNPMVWN